MITDKRIIKTRNAIKNAFMRLVLEKEIGKITVSNVAERAQINRSTFYLHYSDVNAVMKDIEKEIEEKIAACVNSFNIDTVFESTFNMFTSLTDMLNENQTMKDYLLNSTSSDYLIGRLKEILVAEAKSALIEKFPEIDAKSVTYPLTFAAGGIIDSYVKWAHADDSFVSLEELIKTVSVLVQRILEYAA